jgi:hypothetical protein
MKVTGKNGNSIFLPCAGGHYGTTANYVRTNGNYRSGTYNSTSSNHAYFMYF